ncbi:MAG: aminotransferase class I/II-fold pyridoxal phosphate-dependent enzyme, partial [Bacteroidetes bacterium]|nr:aminotransferase class I/II-fold pyridoxal phosphate-dependent enzyme [Bacteroidota bacterium]
MIKKSHYPFNKVYFEGKELDYMADVMKSGLIGSNGSFTRKCQEFIKSHLNVKDVLLTTSCTDALEAVAQLININKGDEIIVPSYTYTTTANAFASKGAVIKFADSHANRPGIDENSVRNLVTDKTIAIVAMHYGG